VLIYLNLVVSLTAVFLGVKGHKKYVNSQDSNGSLWYQYQICARKLPAIVDTSSPSQWFGS